MRCREEILHGRRPSHMILSATRLPRRSARPSSQPILLRGLGAVVLTLALLACSSSATPSHQASPDRSSPAGVAVAYVTALFAGDLSRASTFVSPADRNVLQVISAGQSPSPGQIRNLAVGSTTVNGDSAYVVLTGTLCGPLRRGGLGSLSSGGSASPAPSPPPGPNAGGGGATSSPSSSATSRSCFTNTDPKSINPAFRVALVRSPGSDAWFVTFPHPAT